MTQPTSSLQQGIEMSADALIMARPPRALSGFAPTGAVKTHQWGTKRAAFLGQGMEFAESRLYQAGDDIKHIDWRVSARTSKVHTKLFQAQRERPVYLLIDMRNMMQFGSRVRFKAHLAAEIAAQLAWVGLDGGDRVGAIILTRNGLRHFKAARSQRALLQLLDAVANETRILPVNNTNHEQPLHLALQQLIHLARTGSMAFLISDFNDFDHRAEQQLLALSAHCHITLIQVTDPLEGALPANGGRISNGSNSVLLKQINAQRLNAYHNAFNARCEKLHTLAQQHRFGYHALQTTDQASSILYADNHLAGG